MLLGSDQQKPTPNSGVREALLAAQEVLQVAQRPQQRRGPSFRLPGLQKTGLFQRSSHSLQVKIIEPWKAIWAVMSKHQASCMMAVLFMVFACVTVHSVVFI